jgi:hypothetical protein
LRSRLVSRIERLRQLALAAQRSARSQRLALRGGLPLLRAAISARSCGAGLQASSSQRTRNRNQVGRQNVQSGAEKRVRCDASTFFSPFLLRRAAGSGVSKLRGMRLRTRGRVLA